MSRLRSGVFAIVAGLSLGSYAAQAAPCPPGTTGCDPNGSAPISVAGATVDTGDISLATKFVTLAGPFTLGIFVDPYLGNPDNLNLGGASPPGFLSPGDAATLSLLTLPVGPLGPVAEHVELTDGVDTIDFDFTGIFLVGSITPSGAGTTGSFTLGLLGKFASDTTGNYLLGQSASLALACTQPGTGGAIGCGFAIATPASLTPPVPEPASLFLLGSALIGFGLLRRRRKS